MQRERKGVLERYRQFAEDFPLAGWAVNFAIVACVPVLLFCLHPRQPQFFDVLFGISMTFGMPTFHLVLRCTDEKLREKPLAAKQEAAIGWVSMPAAIGSVAALGAVFVGHRYGWGLDEQVRMALLTVYPFLAMLAIAFGYAGRRSQVGRLGLIIATILLAMVLIAGFAAIIRG